MHFTWNGKKVTNKKNLQISDTKNGLAVSVTIDSKNQGLLR